MPTMFNNIIDVRGTIKPAVYRRSKQNNPNIAPAAPRWFPRCWAEEAGSAEPTNTRLSDLTPQATTINYLHH